MKKQNIYLVFTFLLLIPYLCSLTLIGICYNALVRHSSDLFRSFIGALVGTIIMFAIKATIQRPLDLVSAKVPDNFFKQILRFYSIRRRKLFLVGNCLVDFVLCWLAMDLVRRCFSLSFIIGNSVGIVLLIMLISTCIGAYIEFDILSIDPKHK
jgi:small-conductance mechanosensitive channel